MRLRAGTQWNSAGPDGQGDLSILFSSWLGNAIWLMALAALLLPFIRKRQRSGVLVQTVQAGHES